MKMKRNYLAIILAGLLGMASVVDNAEAGPLGISASADIGVFSQYIWRGAPQNSNKVATQGDFNLSMPVGPGDLTASVWASNTFAAPNPGPFAGQDAIEFDWTLDYSLSVADFGLSVGSIYYTYLRDSTANFDEIYAGISYDGDALPIHPFFTAYYTVAESSITANNLNETGDVWLETGANASVAGIDLSAMVSFAIYDSDPTRTTDIAALHFDNGASVVTLGMSKDFEIAGVTITPSLTGYIPVATKAADGKRYIYNTVSDNNVVLGVNMAF